MRRSTGPRLVSGCGHDEAHAVEVGRFEGPFTDVVELRRVDMPAHLGGDQTHTGAGGGETIGLASADPAAADHEDGHTVEVEEHGIAERRCGFEGHDEKCRNKFTTKLICLVGFD